MLKAIKLRIYPNVQQTFKIDTNFSLTRFVYNQMLNMQKERHANGGKFVNAFCMNNLLPQLKREYLFLKDAESTSLQVANRDLADAFTRFFKHQTGFPKFKSRKHPKQSFQSKNVNNNVQIIDEKRIKLPKLGVLKFKGREPFGKIKSVTVRKSSRCSHISARGTVNNCLKSIPRTRV